MSNFAMGTILGTDFLDGFFGRIFGQIFSKDFLDRFFREYYERIGLFVFERNSRIPKSPFEIN